MSDKDDIVAAVGVGVVGLLVLRYGWKALRKLGEAELERLAAEERARRVADRDGQDEEPESCDYCNASDHRRQDGDFCYAYDDMWVRTD